MMIAKTLKKLRLRLTRPFFEGHRSGDEGQGTIL